MLLENGLKQHHLHEFQLVYSMLKTGTLASQITLVKQPFETS
jgi:hypothetical protein